MKTPHRRASGLNRRSTFDTSSLSRPQDLKPQWRYSLDEKKVVQFSSMSEICLTDLSSSISDSWYTGLGQQRFKRERISDVLSFRRKLSKMTALPPGPWYFEASVNNSIVRADLTLKIQI
jgi:hypothetical protein